MTVRNLFVWNRADRMAANQFARSSVANALQAIEVLGPERTESAR